MDNPFVPLDPESQLGYVLVRVADRVSRHWRDTLHAHGINPRQFSMLAVLAHAPGVSQGELARRVMITPQSVSESLNVLIEKRLISRGDVEAGRAATLQVSASGRRLLAKAYPVVEASNRNLFAPLAPERTELARLLGKLLG